MSVADNIAQVRERISRAARRAGRNPDSIVLMAVSKTVEPERVHRAYEAGIRNFGENRVQEFAEKVSDLKKLPGAAWHLIGHLQTNKAKKAIELFTGIDSLDSLRLAQKLDEAAKEAEKITPVLIEINVGGEKNKSGITTDSPELDDLLLRARQLEHLRVCGLMTIPPYSEDPQGARPYFRVLRNLRDSIASRRLPGIRMDVLSMGMSHDFEVAVEEGSTCIRVGTAIFGERQKAQ
jgi:pyridoxal phosphate enzyme (YggS family)